VYTFTVPTGGQTVVFDGQTDWYSANPLYGSHLIHVATGQDLGVVNGHRSSSQLMPIGFTYGT
jgi:hypothetical protein